MEKIKTDFQPMDPIEPLSLSELGSITNFTLTVTPMAIQHQFSIFGCEYTNAFINSEPRVDMDCYKSHKGPLYSLHFRIPDSAEKLDIFDGLATRDFSFEVQCPSVYIALCAHNDYRVTLSYNRLISSEKYGTDRIYEEIAHHFDSTEMFELNLHLQRINLIEDSTNETLSSNLTLDSHTDFNIATWGNGATKDTTLGRVWFYVDSEQVNVRIQRYNNAQFIGYIIGFNLFWLGILYVLMSWAVKMHFKDSLLREINKKQAKNADYLASKRDCGLIRCLFPTGMFSSQTDGEQQLELDIQSRVSL